MLPQKYIDRIKQLIPETEWELFFEKVTQPLPKTIRLNPHSKLKKEIPKNWQLTPVSEIPEAFFIQRENQKEQPLGKTMEHFSGQIYVQSLSSMLPVKILDPQPEEKILDMCSAPGSKTTFIAEKMENRGLLVCNEPSSSRSKKLSANLQRMGTLNYIMTQSDGTKMAYFFGQEFDKILLDAPCSSEGFARRDASYFDRMWSEKKIFEAAKLQKRLITSAFQMLNPYGTMVYSTCTSAPEENEFIIKHLLDTYPEAELLDIDLGTIPAREGITEFNGEKIPPEIAQKVRRIYPHTENENWSSESFFISLIHKKAPQKLTPPKKPFMKNPPFVLKKQRNAEITTRLAKKFGIDKTIFKPFNFVEKDKEFILTNRSSVAFCQKNLYRKFGQKIIDKDGNITNEFALIFGKFATKNLIQINETQKKRWLEGYEIPLTDFEISENLFEKGDEILVRFGEFCLGYGKVVNGKLKNKLDRNLVF